MRLTTGQSVTEMFYLYVHKRSCQQNYFMTFRTYVSKSFWGGGALRPNAGHGLLILEISRSHTTTHHSRQDSSGRVISSSQRPLPDNTQHSQQTDIHAPGGIRIHNLSSRAAADLRLRPRGPWDRQNPVVYTSINSY